MVYVLNKKHFIIDQSYETITIYETIGVYGSEKSAKSVAKTLVERDSKPYDRIAVDMGDSITLSYEVEHFNHEYDKHTITYTIKPFDIIE